MNESNLVRDAFELLIVVAVGGILVSALQRLRHGQLRPRVCGSCGRPTSRVSELHQMRSAAGESSVTIVDSLPQGDDKVRAVRTMFDRIAPRYELVNRILTFGLDSRWRKVALRQLSLPSGSAILDLACGTGDFCRLLTSAGHKPIGIDLSFGMLENARTEAPLVQADVLRLPFPDHSVDGVTCGFALRNLVELPPFFAELARVVRPQGRIVLLDAYQPSSPILRFGHGIYFGKVVPFVGGLLSDPSAYRYLPKSLGYLPPIDQMLGSLTKAGFHDVQRTTFTGGAAHLIVATRD